MKKTVSIIRAHPAAVLVVVLFVVLAVGGLFWDTPFQAVSVLLGGNILLTCLVLFTTMALATIVAPFTALPLVPIAAAVVHPALVALVTIAGWTVGGVIAFLIARRFGRPLVLRFIREEALTRYEKTIPPHLEFMTLLLLRMVVPVDILSYAVGIISRISLFRYTLATALGVAPFTFLFSYGSTAAWEGEYILFVFLFAFGVVLYAVPYYLLARKRRKQAPETNTSI